MGDVRASMEIPYALIESSEPKEVNQVIGQLVDDQVLKKTTDRKQNFLAPFVLGCIVTFTIMFVVQNFFQVCSNVV